MKRCGILLMLCACSTGAGQAGDDDDDDAPCCDARPTGNDSGVVRLWNMQEEFWLERACELAGRNFTQEEWNQFFPNEPYRRTCSQWPEGS